MESKKGKKKSNFTVMLITEVEGAIRQFHLGSGVVKVMLGVLAAVIIGAAGFGIARDAAVSKEVEKNAALSAQVEKLKQEKEALKLEVTELSDKVTLLSEAINTKVKKENVDAEKHVPNAFPLSGTATIIETQPAVAAMAEGENPDAEAADDGAAEDENAEGAEQPAEQTKDGGTIVNFAAAGGTAVVAAGSGKVVSIADDADYGKALTLDHENGYVTIYYVAAEPKVKEGDELTKGTMLFEIGPDGGILGYQIKKQGEYIDPLQVIEIQG